LAERQAEAKLQGLIMDIHDYWEIHGNITWKYYLEILLGNNHDPNINAKYSIAIAIVIPKTKR
jgi:hypothetical protein